MCGSTPAFGRGHGSGARRTPDPYSICPTHTGSHVDLFWTYCVHIFKQCYLGSFVRGIGRLLGRVFMQLPFRRATQRLSAHRETPLTAPPSAISHLTCAPPPHTVEADGLARVRITLRAITNVWCVASIIHCIVQSRNTENCPPTTRTHSHSSAHTRQSPNMEGPRTGARA